MRILTIIFAFSLLRCADPTTSQTAAAAGDYTYKTKRFAVTTNDDVNLRGHALIPQTTATDPLPVIIFVNSWTLNEFEYVLPARRLAKKGYLTVIRGVKGLNIKALGFDAFCGAILPDGTIQPPCSMGRIQVNNL